jgi:formylglycine-generating enzyme required for sulfatase activity
MMTGNLTRGRPAGMAWRRRFLDRGMSAAMIELLESCFEEQEDRPADAAVLVERLRALIEPSDDQVKSEKASAPTRSRPVTISEPPEIVNSIGMKLRLIPAGEFQMGSTEADDEKPRHLVTISRPFYLGVYPVTQHEYRQVVKKNPSDSSGSERLPVETVSWFDAVEFCNALSRKEGLTPFYSKKVQTVEVHDWNGPGYRLPTEAEWEYACRAGTTTRFSFGDDENALGQYAWYSANSASETHPVGEKKPNAFGLYDMHGNVWEWCWDGYDAHYTQSPAVDPRGPGMAAHRVIRGGSWGFGPRYTRSASRGRFTPEGRDCYLGFRLARGQSGRSV